MTSKVVLLGGALAGVALALARDSSAQTPPGAAASSISAGPSAPVGSGSAGGAASDWVSLEWKGVTAPGTFEEVLALDRKRESATWSGHYEEVIPILEKLVVAKAKAFGPDHAVTLQYVGWLAYVERMTGAWAVSERHYRQMLSALERSRQRGTVQHRNTRRGLIDLYRDKGDLERAEPIAQAILDEAEQDGPEDKIVAQALQDLAGIRRARGAFGDAEALLLHALRIVLAVGKPVGLEYGTTFDAKGREIEVDKATRTREGEGEILRALTLLLLDAGKLADAEVYGRRSVAAAEEWAEPTAPGIAPTVHDLGRVLQAKGDAAGAWQAFARALAIREKAYGGEHPAVATSLHAMARLRLAQGAGAEAEALARRGLAILERAFGPDHRSVADVLEDLAQALAEQGRAAEALPLQDRASAIRDREAQIVLAVGSEAQRRALAAGRRKQTDATLSLASAAGWGTPSGATLSLGGAAGPSEPAAARLALRTLLRAKGRLLDASADEMAVLRARLDDAGRAVFDDLARVTAAISASAARGETAEASPEARDRLARLSAERRRLEALIADRSSVYRADEALATVEDVAARVPGDAALVEVAVYRPFLLRSAKEPRPEATSTPWGEPRYAAYVLRGGEVTSVDLGEAAEVEAAVTKLRAALGDPDLTRDARPAGRAAYDRIFAPIAAKLEGVAHVLWSPDGALSLVPLGALVAPDGRFLVESRLVTYLTSGRDLLRFEGPAEPRSGPLVIAAPDFGALPGAPSAAPSRGGATPSEPSRGRGEPGEASRRSPEGVDMSRIGFLPLPGTAREAEAVEETLASGVVLVGDQATESAVKWAHAPSVLHIATHGFFLPDGPTTAAPGMDPSGSETALALSAESPLVRSGLAFAGANKRASGSEDGILSGLEASSLDLSGTELVVLSACETGLGATVPGDGVYGLRRAFAIAGAETLVMSLWQVDTGRTRELMTAYYGALAAGAGRSEAMRRAQLGMIATKATSHPNVWASFIVSGRWSPLAATKLVTPPKVDPGPRGCACEVGVGLRSPSEPSPSEGSSRDLPSSVRWPIGAMSALVVAVALAGRRLRRLSPRRHGRRTK